MRNFTCFFPGNIDEMQQSWSFPIENETKHALVFTWKMSRNRIQPIQTAMWVSNQIASVADDPQLSLKNALKSLIEGVL